MEVRAISSVISAVRCRWRMFPSCPLKLQSGVLLRYHGNAANASHVRKAEESAGCCCIPTWSSDPACQPKWQWQTAARTWNLEGLLCHWCWNRYLSSCFSVRQSEWTLTEVSQTANCETILASVTVILQDHQEEGVVLVRLWVGHILLIPGHCWVESPFAHALRHRLYFPTFWSTAVLWQKTSYPLLQCTLCDIPAGDRCRFRKSWHSLHAHDFRSVSKYLLLRRFNFLTSKPQIYLWLLSLFLLNQY
jgi:hypothetical protein